jgi:hypothetical protein
MLPNSLFGPRIAYAPENDQGATFDETEIDEGLEELDEPGDEGEDEDRLDEDDGGQVDAGTDEGEDDGRSEASPASQPVRRSRAQARVEEAIRRAKTAEDELARLRSAQPTGPTREQQERDAAIERERLANMDPEQRLEYRIAKQDEAHRREIAQLTFTMQDSADRTAFDGYCARTPVAQKLRDEVEDRLAEMRRGGTTAPRETVLRWVIGDRALANANRAKGRATKRADVNRTSQTTRPGSGRGDTAAEGRRASADSREARARRLEGVKL